MSEVENIKYEDPPITEVSCEIFLDSFQDLSLDNLRDLKNKFLLDYPKIQEGTLERIIFDSDKLKFSKKNRISKVVKCSNDQSYIEFSGDLFTYTKSKPYEKWEIYKPHLLSNFSKYKEITNSKSIRQIKLRYKNEIPLDKIKQINKDIVEIELSDYLNISLVINQEYDPIARLVISLDTIYDNNQRLNLKLSNMPNSKEDIFNINLDLEYIIIVNSNDLPVELLDSAHDRIKKAFENTITSKCRELFKKEDDK